MYKIQIRTKHYKHILSSQGCIKEYIFAVQIVSAPPTFSKKQMSSTAMKQDIRKLKIQSSSPSRSQSSTGYRQVDKQMSSTISYNIKMNTLQWVPSHEQEHTKEQKAKSTPSRKEKHVQGYRSLNEYVTRREPKGAHSWKTGAGCAWGQHWSGRLVQLRRLVSP